MPETPLTSPPETRPRRAVTPRPRRSFWSQFIAGVRLWGRDTFSREKLLSSLKELMWVAPLTALIWVWAEREQTSKVTVQFRVDVRNVDPRFLVQLRDADGRVRPDLQVRAELEGPHARVEEVVQKLAGTALPVDVDTKLGPGIHSVSLGGLGNNPLIEKSGLTLRMPLPREAQVSIDAMTQRDVEVRADPNVTNIEPNAIFEPRKVRVNGPESLLRGATLVAYAKIPAQHDPGVRDIPGVEVVLPFSDAHVTISPPVVSAKVEVKNPEIAGVVNAMPVWAVYPPGKPWDEFKPEFDSTISSVKIIGPAQTVEQVNLGNFAPKPKAILDLGAIDPPIGSKPVVGQRYVAKLTIDFSNSGLKVSPDDTHKTLPFTIVERKAPE
jgi:hypothetical protein